MSWKSIRCFLGLHHRKCTSTSHYYVNTWCRSGVPSTKALYLCSWCGDAKIKSYYGVGHLSPYDFNP